MTKTTPTPTIHDAPFFYARARAALAHARSFAAWLTLLRPGDKLAPVLLEQLCGCLAYAEGWRSLARDTRRAGAS